MSPPKGRTSPHDPEPDSAPDAASDTASGSGPAATAHPATRPLTFAEQAALRRKLQDKFH